MTVLFPSIAKRSLCEKHYKSVVERSKKKGLAAAATTSATPAAVTVERRHPPKLEVRRRQASKVSYMASVKATQMLLPWPTNASGCAQLFVSAQLFASEEDAMRRCHKYQRAKMSTIVCT